MNLGSYDDKTPGIHLPGDGNVSPLLINFPSYWSGILQRDVFPQLEANTRQVFTTIIDFSEKKTKHLALSLFVANLHLRKTKDMKKDMKTTISMIPSLVQIRAHKGSPP